MNALKMELEELVQKLPDEQVAGAIEDLRRRAGQITSVSDPDYINIMFNRNACSDEITISPISGFPNISIGRRVTPEFVAEMIDE